MRRGSVKLNNIIIHYFEVKICTGGGGETVCLVLPLVCGGSGGGGVTAYSVLPLQGFRPPILLSISLDIEGWELSTASSLRESSASILHFTELFFA